MVSPEVVAALFGGSCGAALVSGSVALLQFFIRRRDGRSSQADSQRKALRYLMLYIIQERAKQHIREDRISLEERRSLHHWHDLYHNALGGNGDADALMRQIDALALDPE